MPLPRRMPPPRRIVQEDRPKIQEISRAPPAVPIKAVMQEGVLIQGKRCR